jgi:hypothetical protein
MNILIGGGACLGWRLNYSTVTWRLLGCVEQRTGEVDEGRKVFFSEEKKQTTFAF